MASSERPFKIIPKKLPDDNILDDKIWINLNQCDKLFQEDKSEKQKREIENIISSNSQRQLLENEFYNSLNLNEAAKKKIFNSQNKEKEIKKQFVIIQDPIEGNKIERTDDKYKY